MSASSAGKIAGLAFALFVIVLAGASPAKVVILRAASAQQPTAEAGDHPYTGVAQALANSLVTIPKPKGKAKYKIDEKDRTFDLPTGVGRAALVKLPSFETPYELVIKSMCNCFGFSKKIMVPRGVFLDAEFHRTHELTEDRFVFRSRGRWNLFTSVAVGEEQRDDVYLLLYVDARYLQSQVGRVTQGVLVNWPVSSDDHGTIEFETSIPKK